LTVDLQKSAGVCLVGAGPGDPGLITALGLERLAAADAVVYDALANPRLLAHAPKGARLIDAGKRSREHKLTQDQTNQLLLDLARQGLRVVRLKGGDPYLFGRGAEEVEFLARHGVACEVVPGVTSGIAAPTYAGIPVTHRDHASSVTFVTGHEDPTKGASVVDYRALAALIGGGGTACIYMGVGRVAGIVEALRGGGLADDTPAAAVQWGTLPSQRSVRGTLASIADDIARSGVGAPAIIVVGAVAAISAPGLDFFTARPLFGRTVLITRTRQQASALRVALEMLGAHVLEAPTIQIEPVEGHEDPLDIGAFDWLLLTSVHAVGWLADHLARGGRDARALGRVRVAAVGEATAGALWDRLRIRPDLPPTRGTAAALGQQMAADAAVHGARCLLLRGNLAGDELPGALQRAGAEVVERVVYRNRPSAALPGEVLAALRERRIDWVTFTSASTVRNLLSLLGGETGLLRQVRIASIGPTTGEALRSAGFAADAQPESPSVDRLAEAIAAASVPRSGAG
jgi:uroporphyrinogen III methyltransferase/synthase